MLLSSGGGDRARSRGRFSQARSGSGIHAHTPVAFSGAQSHGLTNLQEGLGNVVSLNAQETDSVTP